MSQTIKITYEDQEFSESPQTALEFFKKHNMPVPLLVKINNKLSDLSSQLMTDCTILPINFDSDEGKYVFWHSSAHILGSAILNVFPDAQLSSGPPIENGFYYDVKLSKNITQDDYITIEKEVNKIIKSKFKFVKETWSKDDLLEFYKNNPYKTYYVNKIENESSIYRCGDFVDFCQGPHLLNTGVVKCFEITKHSSSYFLGKATNDSLQRIYGVSFPSKDLYKNYKDRMKLAKERDHRRIGTENELFFFSELSPGSCFFLPKGAFIYNTLINFLKTEYKKRGFKEVVSPNIYKTDLWETSGHLKNYKENMFCFDVDETLFALKPMNCPGHCVMFKNSTKSYKQLPLRFADFGVLHRNELSGALTGLTRVRRFQQDDAHIFCAVDQIESEIKNCLDFLDYVYGIFKFEYELKLSTRPDKFIGKIETWDDAEAKLKNALKGKPYQINEGDGAFYGPKIDIVLEDALGRKNQCATIQLDFQLPTRFDLLYVDKNGDLVRPVMIHRAIFGSVERFIAILLENYGIKLPFWLSPWQMAIVTVGETEYEYANMIKEKFQDFNVDLITDVGLTLNKKIRNAEIQGYCLIGVIGKKECENDEINIRGYGIIKIDELKTLMEKMRDEFKEFKDLLN